MIFRSAGLKNARFMQKLVFYHVGVELEDHVLKGLWLPKFFAAEDGLELVEAAQVQVLHVVQPVARVTKQAIFLIVRCNPMFRQIWIRYGHFRICWI